MIDQFLSYVKINNCISDDGRKMQAEKEVVERFTSDLDRTEISM